MPSWHLTDAAELAARHPYTFYKSPPEAIAQVRPGEVVKLIFAFHSDDPQAPGAERMWVLVDTVEPCVASSPFSLSFSARLAENRMRLSMSMR